MKLAIFESKESLLGKLCKFFTGCYAYHTAWVDEDLGLIYDRSFLFKRRIWPNIKHKHSTIYLFDFPNVTHEFLEDRLTHDQERYGVFDFAFFAVRKFFSFVGRPMKNAKGKICSDEENEYLRACGYDTPWPLEAPPPSPCDLLKWASARHELHKVIAPEN